MLVSKYVKYPPGHKLQCRLLWRSLASGHQLAVQTAKYTTQNKSHLLSCHCGWQAAPCKRLHIWRGRKGDRLVGQCNLVSILFLIDSIGRTNYIAIKYHMTAYNAAWTQWSVLYSILSLSPDRPIILRLLWTPNSSVKGSNEFFQLIKYETYLLCFHVINFYWRVRRPDDHLLGIGCYTQRKSWTVLYKKRKNLS